METNDFVDLVVEIKKDEKILRKWRVMDHLANRLGVTLPRLNYWLKKYKSPEELKKAIKDKPILGRKQMKKMKEMGFSHTQIAKAFKCSQATVYRLLGEK